MNSINPVSIAAEAFATSLPSAMIVTQCWERAEKRIASAGEACVVPTFDSECSPSRRRLNSMRDFLIARGVAG